MVEGIVADLSRGRIPNLPAEMGLAADLRHDRSGLMRKLAVGAGVAVVAVALMGRKTRSRHRR